VFFKLATLVFEYNIPNLASFSREVTIGSDSFCRGLWSDVSPSSHPPWWRQIKRESWLRIFFSINQNLIILQWMIGKWLNANNWIIVNNWYFKSLSRNWVQVFQHAILRHNKWTICNDPKSRIAGIPTRSGAPAFPVWNRHNMQDAAKCESTRRVRINTLTCVNSHAFTGLRKPPR
jgi:hypothetical protein